MRSFAWTPKGVLQPNLVVEVPSQKNGGISEDGSHWRIRLRDDVRWHDGEPFTAEDVKFTLELITNPKFRAWRTSGHSLVRDIKVVSPTELTWRMEEAFAPYLSFLAETFMVPKHILEKEADPNAAAFNQAPVGTGAFKWAQRIAGDHIELVANTDYVGEGPYLERLVFKYIPDMTVLYTQFKSGDIDLVDQAYITADHYAEASKLPDRVVKLEPGHRSSRSISILRSRNSRTRRSARRSTPQSTGKRSSKRSITGSTTPPRPSCRRIPTTTIRTCRRRSSTSSARARSSTRPAGCPEPMEYARRTGCVCRSPTPPPPATTCASRRSSSCSRHSPRSASR